MRKIGITGKVALSFALITALMLAVITGINIVSYRRQIQLSMTETMNAIAATNTQRMTMLLGKTGYLYTTLSDSHSPSQGRQNKYFQAMMECPENDVDSVRMYQELNSAFTYDVQNSFNAFITYYSVHFLVAPNIPIAKESYLPIYRQRSQLFSLSGNRRIISTVGFDQDDWFRQTCALDGQPHWFSEGRDVCVARKVNVLYEEHPGKVTRYEFGVLLVAIRDAWFQENLVSDKLTDNAYVKITASDGRLLWSNGERVPRDAMEITQQLQDELTISAWIPWSDVSEMMENPVKTGLLLLLVCLVIGLFLVILASAYVSKPIRRLSDFMRNREGELIPDQDMPRRTDEIGTLYRSYNNQITTIKQQEEENKRLIIARLQSQINPHFLYNTLDSLCFLAMMEGKPQIADMLSDTARIFRYNTKDADGEVLLRKELEILELYMGIYVQRSDERIDYTLDCPEELKDQAVIPKMIIQPLAENALFYGMKEHACTIGICCRRAEGQLQITVSDSGRALNLEQINGYLNGEQDMPHHSTGLGIRNVHQRIVMKYGPPYGLVYEKSPEGNTIARVRLPLKYGQ